MYFPKIFCVNVLNYNWFSFFLIRNVLFSHNCHVCTTTKRQLGLSSPLSFLVELFILKFVFVRDNFTLRIILISLVLWLPFKSFLPANSLPLMRPRAFQIIFRDFRKIFIFEHYFPYRSHVSIITPSN